MSEKMAYLLSELLLCPTCLYDVRFPERDVHVSSDGAADRNPRHHGERKPSGHAGNPLPEKQQ